MTDNKPFSILDRFPVLEERHSEYMLSNQTITPIEEVEQLLKDILLSTPSAFNSQPVRIVLLSGDKHIAHWNLIADILIQKIGEERYMKSDARNRIENIAKKAVGTVLFFDDTVVTKEMIEQNPSYKDKFPLWAHQVQGSHQYMTWLGLRSMGYGANLQHYNGMDDARVKAQLDLPEEWDFVAHMIFGSIVEPASAKEKRPIEEMLRVY